MKKTIVKRKKPTLEDLTPKDIRLLQMAYAANEEEMVCFGTSFFKLETLNLVGDDSKITYHGRMFIWNLARVEQTKKQEATQ